MIQFKIPWPFNDTKNISNNSNYDTIKIIRDDINLRYSLLRYMYSQLFLISLNEKEVSLNQLYSHSLKRKILIKILNLK